MRGVDVNIKKCKKYWFSFFSIFLFNYLVFLLAFKLFRSLFWLVGLWSFIFGLVIYFIFRIFVKFWCPRRFFYSWWFKGLPSRYLSLLFIMQGFLSLIFRNYERGLPVRFWLYFYLLFWLFWLWILIFWLFFFFFYNLSWKSYIERKIWCTEQFFLP